MSIGSSKSSSSSPISQSASAAWPCAASASASASAANGGGGAAVAAAHGGGGGGSGLAAALRRDYARRLGLDLLDLLCGGWGHPDLARHGPSRPVRGSVAPVGAFIQPSLQDIVGLDVAEDFDHLDVTTKKLIL